MDIFIERCIGRNSSNELAWERRLSLDCNTYEREMQFFLTFEIYYSYLNQILHMGDQICVDPSNQSYSIFFEAKL